MTSFDKLHSKRVELVKNARKYVGTQEKQGNNVGKSFDYFRQSTSKFAKYEGNFKSDPYCGSGLYAWHLESGINPNVEMPATAASWAKCKNPIRLGFGTTISKIDSIPLGASITYKVKRKSGWGNHVGLKTGRNKLKMTTIDANTSTARSLTKYSINKEGVYEVETGFTQTTFMPICACDYVKESNPFNTKLLEPLKKQYLQN